MASSLTTRNRADTIYTHLQAMIVHGELRPGDRLQTMRALAARFGTSVPTVLKAIKQLDVDGLVVRRQGSGTFVREQSAGSPQQRSVALAIEVGTDIFGDLADALSLRLQEQDCAVGLINMVTGRAAELLDRAAAGNHRCLVIHGNHHTLDQLKDTDFGGRPVVAVIDWDTFREYDHLTRILCDYEAGVRLAVDHLWALGHRRLLIVGTATQIGSIESRWFAASPLPRLVARHWHERGGQFRLLSSRETPELGIHFSDAAWLAAMDDEDAPTAILGLRDVEANIAQRMIRRHCLQRQSHIGIVGYYDTPWSIAGDPPITAVNLNIPEIARCAAAAVHAILDGHPAPSALIPPQLIIRQTSNPAPPDRTTRT